MATAFVLIAILGIFVSVILCSATSKPSYLEIVDLIAVFEFVTSIFVCIINFPLALSYGITDPEWRKYAEMVVERDDETISSDSEEDEPEDATPLVQDIRDLGNRKGKAKRGKQGKGSRM